LSIAALNRRLREQLCSVLGLADAHVDQNSGDISDRTYFEQKELMRAMEARLRTQGNAHWLQRLEAAGIPCGPVNYRSDLYDDPQAQALDLIWRLHNTELGSYRASGHPVRFGKTPVLPAAGAPTLGEHSEAVLIECGYSAEEIAELKAMRAVTANRT
jgi:crotonobetainyl-CoA:carnitine CoA-transferase CaiB-like acyl-CoA transferase